MEDLAPSTVNVRLAAVRKMVTQAKRIGLLSAEEAASLTDIPNARQSGTRLGNWLTKEQARELLAVPDRSTVKGKRDYAILALLVGCALRRRELASLTVEDIQLRENRWVIADLRGKGGRIRTVAVPGVIIPSRRNDFAYSSDAKAGCWHCRKSRKPWPAMKAAERRGFMIDGAMRLRSMRSSALLIEASAAQFHVYKVTLRLEAFQSQLSRLWGRRSRRTPELL